MRCTIFRELGKLQCYAGRESGVGAKVRSDRLKGYRQHINLTGDYAWEAEETLNPDQFKSLGRCGPAPVSCRWRLSVHKFPFRVLHSYGGIFSRIWFLLGIDLEPKGVSNHAY